MRKLLLSFVVICGVLVSGAVFSTSVLADAQTEENIKEICATNPSSSICQGEWKDPANSDDNFNNTLQNIINTLLYAASIIAVIMIVVSGIRFVTSRGNPESTNKARHTLMYSIVGLIIAVTAFAIVNFVLSRL